MEKENRDAYSEVIEILKLLDDEEKLEALPMEMLEILKSKANPEYKPQISKDIPLEEQNLQPETFSILSWIAVKYWNEKLEENEEKLPIDELKLSENSEENKINTNGINEKFNENDLKEETNESISKNEKEEETAIVLYQDLKWYQKIRIKIVELFNKIFKKDKGEKVTL